MKFTNDHVEGLFFELQLGRVRGRKGIFEIV